MVLADSFLPICMTRPKTDELSTVLQFQRRCRNWYWHSLMPVLAPSPMYCMWSWYSWHSFFWPWDRPTSWLHRGWAPMMYISGLWMGVRAKDLGEREGGRSLSGDLRAEEL